MSISDSLNRRAFLTRTAGVGGLLVAGTAGCSPEPQTTDPAVETASSPIPPEKDLSNFILHSETPLTLETRRGAFGSSEIVPHELLYIRNNLPMPEASFVAEPDTWSLTVEGVTHPGSITVGELKQMGLETVATVLQCSGNGRGFFAHETSGSQWRVGAAGCVLWSGIPVRTIADAFGGVAEGMPFLTGTGGEVLPTGLDPKDVVVERSIPADKGLQDALLAWEMNGQALPLAHGGPLRLIVPGYYGCNQIKYIKRLAFTAEESDANIMRTSYRVRPIGESGDPSQDTMWAMQVKSWINAPSGEQSVEAGPILIHGVAFGGMTSVQRVEVSLDGGASWQEAPFVGPDLGPYAWRTFALPVTLEPGSYTLASRATDDEGNTQPENRLENERGYGNTSWRDHALTVTVA